MSAPPNSGPLGEPTANQTAVLRELNVDEIVPNERNPRLDFPQNELDRLADSIDQEGVLVPIVVFPRNDKYVLIDGERRYKCAVQLGHTRIPAVVSTERSEREVLQQMFNIHLIHEPWRDIPTAIALERLITELTGDDGSEPNDRELKELTGLSVDRVRQLRYVMTLPEEWREYIREGQILLNFFWELKKNVLDAPRTARPRLLDELGETEVRNAFVQKRLDKVITDTVSLRKVAPIIRFAAQDADEHGDDTSELDASLRDLVERPEASIEDAYEDTVQMMVEVDKLGRRTGSMVAVFERLIRQTAGTPEQAIVKDLARQLAERLTRMVTDDEQRV